MGWYCICVYGVDKKRTPRLWVLLLRLVRRANAFIAGGKQRLLVHYKDERWEILGYDEPKQKTRRGVVNPRVANTNLEDNPAQ